MILATSVSYIINWKVAITYREKGRSRLAPVISGFFAGLRFAVANAREQLRRSTKFRLFVHVVNKIIEEEKEAKPSRMQLTRTQKIGAAGVGLFFFSILYQTAIFPAILNSEIKRKSSLKPGSMVRGIWSKFPFSWSFQIYLYNVTNPDAVSKGEKPFLQEVGPFVYDEWHEKTNLIDHKEDDTVSYNVKTTYFFNAEQSNGLTGEEELIIPNVFVLALVNVLLKIQPTAIPVIGKAVDSIFKKPPSFFIKVKAKDLLFDGLTINCTATDFAATAICNQVRASYQDYGMKKAAENIYLFSLFGGRNGTESTARTRVKRGVKKMKDVGVVVEHDNKFNISTWDDEYCDTFNGTDGTVFHPKFDKKGREDVVSFSPDICRSLSCTYESKSKVAGVKTLRYTADLGIDPENPLHKCYCEAPDKCPKKGIYDLYQCLKVPIIVSNPHFYLADPYYLEMVDGLKPEKDKHMLFIDFDPFSGSPMYVHKRVQFNMYIMKVEKFKLMKFFPTALLPILWFDEIIILPDFIVKEIKSGHRLYTVAVIFQNLMLIGGLGLMGFAGFLYYKETRGENKLSAKKTVKPVSENNSTNGEKAMNISTVQAPVPPSVD